MIEVVRSGKEKTYFDHCSKCGTDMTYKLKDVQTKNPGGSNFLSYYYIICPVCGNEVSAMLHTEEERKRHINYPVYLGCGDFALQNANAAQKEE